jgi:sulfinoalanine decarboxylase/sulfinoalanine decarboxylase/aspartate 1-decarboxylase
LRDHSHHAEPIQDELLTALEQALHIAAAQLAVDHESLDRETRNPLRLAAELAPRLALGTDGRGMPGVLQDVAQLLRSTPSTASRRFVNQLFGGREPVAVATEWLAVLANSSLYTFKAAGAQVLVEETVLRKLLGAISFEAGEGTFVPGGSLANLLALVLARNAAWPSAREHGCPDTGRAVYSSAEGHYSLRKGAGMIGIGRAAVQDAVVDELGRICTTHLRRQLRSDRERGIVPLLINATAGTTVRGAFDPIDELADLAAEFGAWLHVDGALGASVALSPKYRHLLRGIERADSVSWNPHKLMGVPLQCSALLVRQRGLLAASLEESADYLFQSGAADFDPGHKSIQCGRRNDALKLWALWRRLGDVGWSERIERQFALAAYAAEQIRRTPGMHLVEAPPSVCVCFVVDGCDPAALCRRLEQDGTLLVGHGLVGGRRVVRLVCVNPALSETDLDWILRAVAETGAKITAGLRRPGPNGNDA